MPDEDWLAFVDREARALLHLTPPLTKTALRGAMRDRLGEAFLFPLEVAFRALVAGDRIVAGRRHLEVVPQRLTREAAVLVGPVLVATDRPLQAGSVVDVRVRLEDPRRRTVEVPGLHGEVVGLRVLVPVEP